LAGILALDLVSPALPSEGATAMDETSFQQVLYSMSFCRAPTAIQDESTKVGTSSAHGSKGKHGGTRWSERRKSLAWGVAASAFADVDGAADAIGDGAPVLGAR